jgi:hypothetical protein
VLWRLLRLQEGLAVREAVAVWVIIMLSEGVRYGWEVVKVVAV